ncbi:MAG: helix-turn-helix transcriptional regulator [Alphaproteobacteria bacterium]
MREKKLNRQLGQRVKQLRRLKGLTQEELADAINRSVDTVSNIERGFSSTRLDTVAQLAKVLSVTLPEMFDFPSAQEKGQEKGKAHRKEIDRLTRLLVSCPANRLPTVTKIIEQALELTTRDPS